MNIIILLQKYKYAMHEKFSLHYTLCSFTLACFNLFLDDPHHGVVPCGARLANSQ